jgi:hypothetical protein
MCSCNGGKPVNLRTPSLPPIIDPNAVAGQARTVRQKLTRSDFVNTRVALFRRLRAK